LSYDRVPRRANKSNTTVVKANKPVENACQQDAAEFFSLLISFLHNDLKKGFIYVVPTRVFGDIKLQIADASKNHWALTLMDEQYSVMHEMFLHQVILIRKCLECNKETYSFEVNNSICIKYDPTMKSKRFSILELLHKTFGNLNVLDMYYILDLNFILCILY